MRFCVVLLAAALSLPAADAPMTIMEAARRGLSRDVETLLAKGANIESKDEEGRTPLMIAAQHGRADLVRLLLGKGAQPDARDTHGWNAYMLALLAPAHGLHTHPDAVIKLLPQPKRFRLAVTARWAPGKALFSSCFLRPADLTQHMRELHPDGMVIEALQRYAASSGHAYFAIVSTDARGNSDISERSTPADVDGVLELLVEPGAACVQQSDQLSMLVHATVTRPGAQTPLYDKSFSYGLKTGLREEVAANPNQYRPIYLSWAKSQAGSLYWAALTGLLMP